jgi:hypothetical protein
VVEISTWDWGAWDEEFWRGFAEDSRFGGYRGNRGGGGDRQLTAEEFAPIFEEFKKMLTDKCKEFIDRLVSHNTGQAYDSGKSLVAHVNAIAASPQAGIFYGPGATRGRQRFGDLEGVNIGEWVDMRFQLPAQRLRTPQLFASTLLHEAVHTITKGIDDILTQNVLELGIVPVDQAGRPLPLPKTKGHNSDYHRYWSAALKNACFPGLQ